MNTLATKIIILALLQCFSFTLMAHVVLDYPKGGETFDGGQTVNIQWHVTISHTTLNWDLYFSGDGGTTWTPIELDLPAGDLSYQWEVPGNFTTQGQVRVVQDNDGMDYEDMSMNFTIQGTSATSSSDFSDLDVKIFPNPVHDMLKVEIDSGESLPAYLALYNEYGLLLWTEQDQAMEIFIPVSQYAPGVYFLQVITPLSTRLQKVIIE